MDMEQGLVFNLLPAKAKGNISLPMAGLFIYFLSTVKTTKDKKEKMMNSDFKPRNIYLSRQKRRANLAISVGILFFSLFCLLTACSDKKETERLLQKEPALVVPAEPLLPKKYTFLVIEPIAIPAELANDYPKAASDCQLQLHAYSQGEKAFSLFQTPAQPGVTAMNS